MFASLRRPRTWLIAVPVIVFLVVVVAPFTYIHFIKADADPRLTLAAATTTTASTGITPAVVDSADGAIDGTWTTTEASVAGYRVKEVLFGQDADATGRTSQVDGTLVISGTTVESARFTVDMTSISSDESRRDSQFNGRIMQTSTYPTSTFELTKPIELGSLPADGERVTMSVTGDLTLHGVTKSVTFDLVAQRNGAAIEVNGTIPIVFDDYHISDPSGGPATVVDHGEVEFLLVFGR